MTSELQQKLERRNKIIEAAQQGLLSEREMQERLALLKIEEYVPIKPFEQMAAQMEFLTNSTRENFLDERDAQEMAESDAKEGCDLNDDELQQMADEDREWLAERE